ncbi:MAG: hypothetical protein ACPGOZ_05350, partial [Candidatus Puniceispirillum sp.]
MKIFRNSQPVFLAGMLVALTSLASMHALAQDTTSSGSTKPLDLITLGTTSTTAGDNQTEAIVYDASKLADDDAASSLAPSLGLDAENQNATTGPDSEQADITTSQDTTAATVDNAQADTEIQTLESTSAAYGSAKLGRRKISDVGLAAIGVSDAAPQGSTLDSLIWRGTPAKNAAFLLENGAVANQSPSLSALAYDVVARQSVPPMGANMIAADLVRARLAWLARAGRSNDLAMLVEQLPDNEKWSSWKRWLVEHHLMSRRDDIACATVAAQIEMTLDPFWHQAKVICDAVQGDMSSARFAADVLAATGMGDPTFMGLVDELFTGNVFDDIDP